MAFEAHKLQGEGVMAPYRIFGMSIAIISAKGLFYPSLSDQHALINSCLFE
jgi:hypothetical protein